MTKSQIFTAAHKLAKATVAQYNYCNYLATFGACLKFVYANGTEENKDEVKEYSLYIPFNEKKDQKRAKQYLSARWDSKNKSWGVTTSLNEIKKCGLSSYLKTEEKEAKKDTETNGIDYAEAYTRFGMDFAEEGNY